MIDRVDKKLTERNREVIVMSSSSTMNAGPLCTFDHSIVRLSGAWMCAHVCMCICVCVCVCV